jgi:lipoprotein-anchoring transpeptidase ErfK/SrfK
MQTAALNLAVITLVGSLVVAASLLGVPRALAQGIGLTPTTINGASLIDVPAQLAVVPSATTSADGSLTAAPKMIASASVVKMEVLLDRYGASPGVIDGFDGENLRKAVSASEIMLGEKPDGVISTKLLTALQQPTALPADVIGTYVITAEDVTSIVPPIPSDYGELAKLAFLGYTSVPEELAERFHMDQKFFEALNPGAKFVTGETVYAAVVGPDQTGKVARIEADKVARQVRAYDGDGKLLVAYPATIGSDATPSPSGQFTVITVAENPTYTYNPNLNFKQGDNDKVLTIPPGPNGPVGSVWIALSQPTFGIHGTPEPSLIDKAASHGCVRLTNWDAEELAKMVSKGVIVDFLS